MEAEAAKDAPATEGPNAAPRGDGTETEGAQEALPAKDTLAELRRFPYLHRAYALLLDPAPQTVLLVGGGTAPLVRHLLARGIAVVVTAQSVAATSAVRKELGDEPGITFWEGELGGGLQPASIDAILVAEVIAELSPPVLTRALQDWQAALRPGGAICVQTRKQYDIGLLAKLFSGTFATCEVFGWNGFERIRDQRPEIGLFAIGHATAPYAEIPISGPEGRVAAAGGVSGWLGATVADRLSLPARWLLRAELHVHAAPDDGVLQFIFQTADPKRQFWAGCQLKSIMRNPADVVLSSELLVPVGDPRLDEIERIVMRVRSESGGELDVRIFDLSFAAAPRAVSSGAVQTPPPDSLIQLTDPVPSAAIQPKSADLALPRRRSAHAGLPRISLTSKLYDPRDYKLPAYAQIRRYLAAWQFLLGLENMNVGHPAKNLAWAYAQSISSVPFDRRSVLDLGTGTSLIPIYLARMLDCKVTTFDQQWRAERKELYEAAGVLDRIDTDVGDLIAPLPYRDDSFDIVTGWCVIEHLWDDTLAVSEIKRVCSPGGHICLATGYAERARSQPEAVQTLDREGLERLIDRFKLTFVGKANYDNVSLDNASNCAIDAGRTFASIVLQN